MSGGHAESAHEANVSVQLQEHVKQASEQQDFQALSRFILGYLASVNKSENEEAADEFRNRGQLRACADAADRFSELQSQGWALVATLHKISGCLGACQSADLRETVEWATDALEEAHTFGCSFVTSSIELRGALEALMDGIAPVCTQEHALTLDLAMDQRACNVCKKMVPESAEDTAPCWSCCACEGAGEPYHVCTACGEAAVRDSFHLCHLEGVQPAPGWDTATKRAEGAIAAARMAIDLSDSHVQQDAEEGQRAPDDGPCSDAGRAPSPPSARESLQSAGLAEAALHACDVFTRASSAGSLVESVGPDATTHSSQQPTNPKWTTAGWEHCSAVSSCLVPVVPLSAPDLASAASENVASDGDQVSGEALCKQLSDPAASACDVVPQPQQSRPRPWQVLPPAGPITKGPRAGGGGVRSGYRKPRAVMGKGLEALCRERWHPAPEGLPSKPERLRQRANKDRRAIRAADADEAARRLLGLVNQEHEEEEEDALASARQSVTLRSSAYAVAPVEPLHGASALDLQVWRATVRSWQAGLAHAAVLRERQTADATTSIDLLAESSTSLNAEVTNNEDDVDGTHTLTLRDVVREDAKCALESSCSTRAPTTARGLDSVELLSCTPRQGGRRLAGGSTPFLPARALSSLGHGQSVDRGSCTSRPATSLAEVSSAWPPASPVPRLSTPLGRRPRTGDYWSWQRQSDTGSFFKGTNQYEEQLTKRLPDVDPRDTTPVPAFYVPTHKIKPTAGGEKRRGRSAFDMDSWVGSLDRRFAPRLSSVIAPFQVDAVIGSRRGFQQSQL